MLCNVKFIADKTLGKLSNKYIGTTYTQLKVNSSDTNRTLLVCFGVIMLILSEIYNLAFLREFKQFFQVKLYRFIVRKGQFTSV